jgi:hypothetical protein
MKEETIHHQGQGRGPARRRIGRFIVGHDTFRVDWRALLPLFAKVVPVRAESLFHVDGIEYLALCEDFDEIEMEETPPMYEVTYRTAEDGRELFIFTRAGARFEGAEEHPTSKSGPDGRFQHSTSNDSI